MTNVATPHKSEYFFQCAGIPSPIANQYPISIREILNNMREWDREVVTEKITQFNCFE